MATLNFFGKTVVGIITFGVDKMTIFHRHFRVINGFKDLKAVVEDQASYDQVFETLDNLPEKKLPNKAKNAIVTVSKDLSVTFMYSPALSATIHPIRSPKF